ncbi:MAG: hypothetical protein HYX72_06835 [Acidobacteria bacterium]|nr:hypothetical protein [Acidobacteriota bacterium]
MENYFNYFTEIEEYFWKKRGTALFVSTLDWALIDTWKESQIPLEAVLKGIDRAFEKHDAKKRKVRAVNSLAYCQQEVLAAAQEGQRNKPATASTGQPFPREELTRFFGVNAEAVENAAVLLQAQNRPESAATFRQIASSLRKLAAAAASDSVVNLEDVERRLNVLEDKIFSILLACTDEREMVEMRSEMDRQLAPVRGKMSAEQVSSLQKQFLQRKLLERAALARLSLFYL